VTVVSIPPEMFHVWEFPLAVQYSAILPKVHRGLSLILHNVFKILTQIPPPKKKKKKKTLVGQGSSRKLNTTVYINNTRRCKLTVQEKKDTLFKTTVPCNALVLVSASSVTATFNSGKELVV